MPHAAGDLFGQYKMIQKKTPEKWLKPWHMGTGLKVLSESYTMNAHMTGFKWFSKTLSFASLCLGWN